MQLMAFVMLQKHNSEVVSVTCGRPQSATVQQLTVYCSDHWNWNR